MVIIFTTRIIIAQPLEDSVPEDVKGTKMQYRNTTLKKIKNYIDNELNSSKKNFRDKTKDDYAELQSNLFITATFGTTKTCRYRQVVVIQKHCK